MKITKTQLRQIIKEEVSRILNETNLIKEDMGISQDYAHMFKASRSEGDLQPFGDHPTTDSVTHPQESMMDYWL